MISNFEREWQLEVNSEAFNSCSGWLGGLNDCFASKGFQLARIETPSEKYVFILNTHLDAGRSTSDRKVRADQLNQILAKVEKVIDGEALIVAGDLNLRRNDPQDSHLLEAFKKDLGLLDSFGGVKNRPSLDYILYRNGTDTTLEVLEVGINPDFQYDNKPLSDHPALFIRLLIR